MVLSGVQDLGGCGAACVSHPTCPGTPVHPAAPLRLSSPQGLWGCVVPGGSTGLWASLAGPGVRAQHVHSHPHLWPWASLTPVSIPSLRKICRSCGGARQPGSSQRQSKRLASWKKKLATPSSFVPAGRWQTDSWQRPHPHWTDKETEARDRTSFTAEELHRHCAIQRGTHALHTAHAHPLHSTLQGTPHGSTQPACLWQPHVQTALLPPTPPRQGRRCKHRAALSYWRENTFHISEGTASSSPSKPDPVMLRPRRPPASCLLPTAPLPFPWHMSLWRDQAGLLSPRSRTPPQPRALRGSRAAHFHSSCDWTDGWPGRPEPQFPP